ncbi:MAG: hypothetical protein ACM3S5_10565 [Rhodospirillales bacterium]
MRSFLITAVFVFAAIAAASFQDKPAGSGHWEGTIQVPDRELKVAVDLALNEKGEWIGTIAVPEQNMRDFPLAGIAVKGTSVAFELPGIPGAPAFQGNLSSDGKMMKGELAQGGGLFPMQLKWVSAADVKLPAKNAPIDKEFEGAWQGVLTTPNGQKLRIRITLANSAEGAKGTLASLDQSGAELPFTSITQKASEITLELKFAGIVFTGELKGEGLSGTFTQGGASMPLVFTRVKN